MGHIVTCCMQEEDPCKYKSKKTGRGPLEKGKWQVRSWVQAHATSVYFTNVTFFIFIATI